MSDPFGYLCDSDPNSTVRETQETRDTSLTPHVNNKASNLTTPKKRTSTQPTSTFLTEFTKRKNWPQKIICGLKDIYYVITNSSKFIFCSPSCQELTGYSPAELVGRNISDFIHVDDIDPFIRDLNCGALKKSFSLFYRFRKKDDKFVMLEVQCRPYFVDDSINPTCFFCNARQYPSKASSLLDTFLELKVENEFLRRRLKEHGHITDESSTPSTSSTGEDYSNIDPTTPADSQSLSYTVKKCDPSQRSSIDLRGGSVENPSRNSESESGVDEDTLTKLRKKKKLKTDEEQEQQERACTECGTTKSPEWRRGSQGPKT
ncbi:hypothetical protein K7432_003647 [Basidiobolus ranarum]